MMIHVQFKGMQCDYCKRVAIQAINSKDFCLLHLFRYLYEIDESFVNVDEINKTMRYLENQEVEDLR